MNFCMSLFRVCSLTHLSNGLAFLDSFFGTNADQNHSAYGDAQNHSSLVVMK